MTHFVIEVWRLVRGRQTNVNHTNNIYKTCVRNTGFLCLVVVCACLILWMFRDCWWWTRSDSPLQQHREAASNWKRRGGGITSNLHTRILRHWVKKQMLWSSIKQRGGLCCDSTEGHRTSVSTELWGCERWHERWKDCCSTEGCKWNIVSLVVYSGESTGAAVFVVDLQTLCSMGWGC